MNAKIMCCLLGNIINRANDSAVCATPSRSDGVCFSFRRSTTIGYDAM